MTDYYSQIQPSCERERLEKVNDRIGSSGANDYDADSRVASRTSFNYEEGPAYGKLRDNNTRSSWKRLYVLNEGVGESDRSINNNIAEYLKDIRLLGSICGLSDDGIERACNTIESIDCRFSVGDTIEDVLLAALVCGSGSQRDMYNNNKFNECVEKFESSESTIRRISEQIYDRVNEEHKHDDGTADCFAAQFDADVQYMITKYVFGRISGEEMIEYVEGEIDSELHDEFYVMLRNVNCESDYL